MSTAKEVNQKGFQTQNLLDIVNPRENSDRDVDIAYNRDCTMKSYDGLYLLP